MRDSCWLVIRPLVLYLKRRYLLQNYISLCALFEFIELGKIMSSKLLHLSESQVLKVLNWPVVYETVEQALGAVTNKKANNSQSTAFQPARNFTRTQDGTKSGISSN